VELQPISGLGPLFFEVSRWHTTKQTHTHARALSGSPLNEWSAHCSGRYLCDKQQTRETKIHALSEIRIRDSSTQEAVDLCLRPYGHWVRHNITHLECISSVHHLQVLDIEYKHQLRYVNYSSCTNFIII